MNEALTVFLNLDEEKQDENEALIRRIDDLLLTAGFKYSGFRNMYVPVNARERDRAAFEAKRLLKQTPWLEGVFAYSGAFTLTNACAPKEILTNRMTAPSQKKLKYYEEYYKKTGKLPHAVVVDENKRLRDGYISYLLAWKYEACANMEVYEAFSDQPLKKVVCGRHVRMSDGTWMVKGKKRYWWTYTLKAPVVPGDILQVKTKNGLDFICVDRVDYVTGKEFCATYKRVRAHMGARLEEEGGENHGK